MINGRSSRLSVADISCLQCVIKSISGSAYVAEGRSVACVGRVRKGDHIISLSVVMLEWLGSLFIDKQEKGFGRSHI